MDKRPIGMMDSGLGGLSVLRVLRKTMPNESLVFVGDQGHFPYGTKTQPAIRQLATAIGRFLVARDAKLMVVACNTATAAALPTLQQQLPIPVIGVIQPGASAALASRPTSIGVIGTESTIKNGAYEQAIRNLNKEVKVISHAAQPLVSIVEHGKTGTPLAQQTVDEELAPFKGTGIQNMILGCTHFPFLSTEIHHTLGKDVKLIDPAFETVKQVQKTLQTTDALAPTQAARVELYTTGVTADLRAGAKKWLDNRYDTCDHIDLDMR